MAFDENASSICMIDCKILYNYIPLKNTSLGILSESIDILNKEGLDYLLKEYFHLDNTEIETTKNYIINNISEKSIGELQEYLKSYAGNLYKE